MKRLQPTYHSALWEETDAPPCQRVELAAGIALQNDIRNGFPEEFKACDVIYSEPPWPAGFDTFNERAGVIGGKYRSLIEDIGRAISQVQIPVFLMVCKAAIRYLPIPLQQRPIGMAVHGGEALLAAYRQTVPDTVKDTDELLLWLALEYQCIGDFCCGYGRTGRLFAQAGRRFVLADFNVKCIGYIAHHGKDWQ